MFPNNPLEPPPDHDTHPVEHIGKHTDRGWVDTTIYQTDDAEWYYFSCNTCGNSGQHWHSKDFAIVQAVYHVQFFDHTPYLETPDEQ